MKKGEKVKFKRLNIKLTIPVHSAFKNAANADGRSIQTIVVALVKKFVEESSKKKCR